MSKRPKSDPANPWPGKLKKLRAQIATSLGQVTFTQGELAKLLRVTIRSVGKWENGRQVPSPSHQLLIELLEEKYS